MIAAEPVVAPGGVEYLLALMGVLAVGALVAVIFTRASRACGWLSVLFAAAAFCCAVAVAGAVASQRSPIEARLLTVPFFGSSLTLYVDYLSAFFLVVITFVGLMAAVFSIEYLPSLGPVRAAAFYPLLLLFLLGMCAVVSVMDLLFFIAAWEFMSLPAYCLVVYEHQRRENLRAALKYFILSHVGNLGLFIAVLALYAHCHSFAMGDMSHALAGLAGRSPVLANVLLGAVVLAFATKAGLFPTGDWLPDAHPAAPSPVSAVLSGVMIKLGAFGVLRVMFGLMAVAGGEPAVPVGWAVGWGVLLATWGAASVILGSSAAIASTDSKRLLAYSSISQSGYIFLAIGVGLATALTMPAVAAIALVAAAFHVAADALHKSALFLTAGSVLYRTHTRRLDDLGGLEERMPSTCTAAVVAAASLAGLPFTAAFVSKWLLIQSALWAGERHPLLLAYALAALFGSVLAVGYGLKYVGAIFLGPPSKLVERLHDGEVPATMNFPQLLLAALCLAVGVVPLMVLEPAMRVAAEFVEVSPRTLVASPAGLLPAGPAGFGGAYLPPVLLVLLALAAAGAYLWSRSGGATVREVEGWACGEQLSPDEIRPRASGYYWAITEFLGRVYPRVGLPKVELPKKPARALDIDTWGFDRLARWLKDAAYEVGRWHSGLTQYYVLWQVIGIIVVAVVVAAVVR